MKSLSISLLGLLVLSTPVLAVESTKQAPIKIVSCVVDRDESHGNAQFPGAASTNGVTAVIINTSTKTIKDLQASGIYNGATVTDTIQGPFAPGQTYTLHKSHVPEVYVGPDASCVLNHVTFADGTEWQTAEPPARS